MCSGAFWAELWWFFWGSDLDGVGGPKLWNKDGGGCLPFWIFLGIGLGTSSLVA